jgi:stage II sporulation protein B
MRDIVKGNNKISVHINRQRQSNEGRIEPIEPIEKIVERKHERVHSESHHPFYPKNAQKRNSFWQKYRSFFYATMTAICIGVFLGFIMLKIFVDTDPNEMLPTQNQTTQTSITPTETNEKESSNVALESYTGNVLQAYVVQANVFSSKEGADKFVSSYPDAVIWERDAKYHIFVSVDASSDTSKNYAKQHSEESLELYGGKVWTTDAVSFNVSNEEVKWLQLFEQTLQAQFEKLDKATIQEVVNGAPSKLTDSIQSFVEDLEEKLTKSELTKLDIIAIWQSYTTRSET